jgi:Tetratricopeptide repeat/NB-ARC domain
VESAGGGPRVRQQAEAGRDAYTAARDVVVHYHAPDTGPGRAAEAPRRRIWGHVPARNPGFTGREQLLAAVRDRLLAGDRAVVQALHGMGGVGKTQLAAEYAHRFAGDYDVVWWIAAEQAALIGEQFAGLADELGCAPPGAGPAAVRQAVLGELRARDRWLLVFDNAEDPADVMPWLPGGAGHVLITSRARQWSEIAVPVEIGMLARGESVAILQDRIPELPAQAANEVADAVGDLPLGVVQAAAYMADTGIPAGEYTDLLAARAADILAQGRPPSYPRSLAAAVQLAFDRLDNEDPSAVALAGTCSFLAAAPIPADWFTSAATHLPGPLAAAAADPLAWRQVLARLGRSALARIDRNELAMHRLTQAVVRSHLDHPQAAAMTAAAEAILAAARPENGVHDPRGWPVWARLLPHLLVIHPAARPPGLRRMAGEAAFYLIRRGDPRAGRDYAARLYQQQRDRRGPDDRDTLQAAAALAYALRETGHYRQARDLQQDILARRRRVLGGDDPDTLGSAISLAIILRLLGDPHAARDLDEDTLIRYRRTLGDDHRQTLRAAANLANDLHAAGEVQAARDLQQDTLIRRRRVLGDDHIDTLTSAENLAVALRALGDPQAARELDEDTLARRRRILGDDHPHTLTSASNLASVLRALGDPQAARELDEDTLARRRRILGEDHPDALATASNLAEAMHPPGETRPETRK